jgi:hypothetical protein
MKRTPLKRGVTQMKRGGALRPRSKKRQEVYARKGGRRDFVAAYLREHPKCEAHISVHCQGQSVDVHEKLARSQGGNILPTEDGSTSNFLALCRYCHSWIGDHPNQARLAGLRYSRYHKSGEGD